MVLQGEFAQMSVSERIQLAQDLWDSIGETQEEIPLTQGQKNELDRRWELYVNNPQEVVTWPEIMAKIKNRK